MFYCKKCLLPSTKPYISFDENGLCNACQSHDLKKNSLDGINWEEREKEFEDLIDWAKAQNAPMFDAAVPVSGGKDSITQVHRLLNRGLRILAIHVDYGIKTEIGKENLDIIPKMGAHLITIRPELTLHKELIRLGLEDYGDPDLLSHTMLHGFPLRTAIKFSIPLFLHGENSAFEYGGDKAIAGSNEFTRDWFMKFAANKGVTAEVIAEKYDIDYNKLKPYDYPDDEADFSKTKAVFMSHYFYWDSEKHLEIANSYGFKSLDAPREGTYRTFVGIDEKINRLHQYLKVLKFGYGRGTDHACEDIRNGLLTREQAKELIAKYDLQPLGEDFISDIASFLEYSNDELVEIIERYRDKEIWSIDSDGQYFIEGHLTD